MFEAIKAKCSACLLKKNRNLVDFPVLYESLTSYESLNGGDVLVYLDRPLEKKGRELERIKNGFKSYGLNCDFFYGVECEVDNVKMPSPLYGTYKNCNTQNNIELSNYKVIITIGRALYAITRGDDIPNWQEFVEYQFNPTYFYTALGTSRTRVYPFPSLDEFFAKDNFENKVYVKHQLTEIKKYLAGDIDSREVEPYSYEIVDDANEFLRSNLKGSEMWAFDTETRGLNPYIENPAIKCLTLSKDGKTAYYLRFMDVNTGEIFIDISILSEFLLVKKQIWANGKFDCKWLEKFNVKNCRVDEDVILLFHFLSTERSRNSIKTNCWMLGFGGYERKLDDVKSKLKIKDDYTKIPEIYIAEYASIDVIVTFRLFELGLKLAALQPRVFQVYHQVLEVIPAFLAIEMRGADIDFDYTNKINKELLLTMKDITANIKRELNLLADNDVNSPEKLGKAIEKLKWPCLGRTFRGFYNTADTELKEWEKLGYTQATLIMEYRKISKLQQTFIGSTETSTGVSMFGDEFDIEPKDEGLMKYICYDTKIHPGYNVAMADTARTKHSAPNIAAFPSQGKEAKIFKPVIKCPDDYYIMNMDVAGFQLRLGAIYSGDKNMMDAFINLGGDLHSMTCRNLFARDLSIEEFMKVKKQEPHASFRIKSKRINFALEFGAIPKTLVENLKEDWVISDVYDYLQKNNIMLKPNDDPWLEVAKNIRFQFFQLYYRLEEWHNEQRIIAAEQGYVDTLEGYRRHLPFLKYKGKNEDNKRYFGLWNVCLNTVIQSAESLMMYRNMTKCYNRMLIETPKSSMMSMIHDYVGFYVHKSEILTLFNIVSDSFEDFTTYKVPIEVEISVSKIWESQNATKLTRQNIEEVADNIWMISTE